MSTVISPKQRDSRLIDGSKTCAQLLEDHLQNNWCASPMNVFFDRQGRLFSFIFGGFLLDFIFSQQDDMFFVVTTLYSPKHDGAVDDLDGKVLVATEAAACGYIILSEGGVSHRSKDEEIQSTLESCDNIQMIQYKDGTVIMAQMIQAASLLVDEALEQTLGEFLTAAGTARKAVLPPRKKMSWFGKKAE
ncbi:hypothetical protein MHU86_6348 [Fragilaria crotonensis]|nr:hypothetical protein MHU86_6348 [Fragilaria crotonensis]